MHFADAIECTECDLIQMAIVEQMRLLIECTFECPVHLDRHMPWCRTIERSIRYLKHDNVVANRLKIEMQLEVHQTVGSKPQRLSEEIFQNDSRSIRLSMDSFGRS